jgi:hypothetical protein
MSTRRSRLKLFFGGVSVLVGGAFAALVVYLGWRQLRFLTWIGNRDRSEMY